MLITFVLLQLLVKRKTKLNSEHYNYRNMPFEPRFINPANDPANYSVKHFSVVYKLKNERLIVSVSPFDSGTV
jgi:hypothetical protein